MIIFIFLITVFALMGIIFIGLGIGLNNADKNKQKRCTSRTYGTVIDLVEKRVGHGHGNNSYGLCSVFEYTVGNLKFKKESKYCTPNPKFAIGQKVEIYFNPEDYHDFYVPEESASKSAGILFALIGAIFTVVAIIIGAVFLAVGI